jgi:hypothetical protein
MYIMHNYPMHIRTALWFFRKVHENSQVFSVRVHPRVLALFALQEKRTVLLLELRRLSPRTKTSFSELQNPSIDENWQCKRELERPGIGPEELCRRSTQCIMQVRMGNDT